MSKIIKVYLEPTFLCNLRCKFCYVGDMQLLKNSSSNLLDNKDAEQLIGYLHKIFFELGNDIYYDVDILGGEPTLSSNLIFIVSYISQNFKIRRFTLTSNGTLLTQKLLNQLIVSGIKEFRISLHGTEKIHNDLVGKSVFSRVVESIGYLKKRKVSYTLIYVVNKCNYFDILNLLDYLDVYNLLPGGIFFEFVEFSGYALDFMEELNVVYDATFVQYINNTFFKIKQKYKVDITITNYPKCILNSSLHSFVDDDYNENHRYELYYSRLARKSLFGFTPSEQRVIIKNHLRIGYSLDFQTRLLQEVIPQECSKCQYKRSCYLLIKETILYKYLGYDFLKRMQYFDINKKNIPGS